MIRRSLAAFLSAALVLTAAPAGVFADDTQSVDTGTAVEEIADESADESEQTDESSDEEQDSSESDAESEDESPDDADTGDSSDSDSDTEDSDSETGDEEESTDSEDVTAEPVLTAEVSEDEKTIKLRITGLDEEAESVLFPVWSAKDGQDDLEWISAKKQEDGSWSASVSVKKHKDAGLYYIHCYQTIDGKMVYAAAATAEITPLSGTVSVEELDAEKGTFTVRVSDLIVPSGVKKVQVPIWGAADGQNDIVWYEALKDGEDYLVEVDAADHQYENGLYHIHCYVTDEKGLNSFIGKANAELEMKNGVTAELSEDEKTITVTARGINTKATAVTFPVWSAINQQDDIKWISATKKGSGVWTAEIPVKGHKDPGLYHIHCYQTVSGSMKYFDKTAVTVTSPSGTVAAGEADEESGVFEVTLSDLNVPSGVKQVQFAVWGSENAQNDLVWHTGVKSGDTYTAVITPGEHKFETGKYYVHCYITDNNSIKVFAGSTEVNVSMKEGISAVPAADEKTVKIQYVGPKAGDSLKAAVWSSTGGQDDLVWYNLKQNGNGAVCDVTISKHKTAGSYYVHLYTGKNVFVDSTQFTISGISSANVTISSVNGSKGTFKVTVSGISTPSGLEKVMIPVWPKGNQGKINWYTATRSGDNYTCTVNVSKHQRTFGTYVAHAYGYANNGIMGFAGGTETELIADKYMYSEKTGTYTTRVWIINPGSDAAGVTFKAWSNTNGQDDAVSYTGVKSGSSSYYADIKSSKHKNGGTYTTEAYVTTSEGNTLAGSITYSMAKEGAAKNQAMYQYAQGFSSDTNYLILVNRGLHRVAIYQGSKNNWKEIKYWPCVVGKPSTPTPTGTYKIKGRFDWFGSDHKCWWATQIEGYYYFHTVLYYWGDAPTRILDGTMDAAASMGCVRLEEPNARWIYTTIPRGTTVHIYN